MVYQTEHFENRAGGKGWIHIEHLLPEEEKEWSRCMRE